jgi:myo-inositol-1(or 4)-monophosphatase
MQREEVRALLEEVAYLITGNLASILETRYEFKLKHDGTPVTQSDLLIEQRVRRLVEAKLSNVSFIGEESFDFVSRSTDGYRVVLDPIDGTENFCSGLKEWGVSFGIWKDAAHLGSLLLLPEMGLRLMTGDHVIPVNSRLIGLSSSMSAEVLNILQEPGEYRIYGCAVYNIYNVIHGYYQKFINPKGAYVWDLLPGIMLALEQGCNVLIEGKPYLGEWLDPTRKYRIEIRR